jgi:hypothetical protein
MCRGFRPWARLDSNQGPTDYEKAQQHPGASLFSLQLSNDQGTDRSLNTGYFWPNWAGLRPMRGPMGLNSWRPYRGLGEQLLGGSALASAIGTAPLGALLGFA